jgi:uncharacterized membrane protein
VSPSSRIYETALPTLPGYPPPARSEPHWPPQLTILVAIVLQIVLPDRLVPGPRWLLPGLEALVLLTLFVASPQTLVGVHTLRRRLAVGVTALVSIANAISLGLLVSNLLHRNPSTGKELIVAGLLIWITNILAFALWFWELDRGGPGRRAEGHDGPPDFQFPQIMDDRLSPGWRPIFLDYLYVSVTNAFAFSPTDTMPLTVMAKSLMGVQSLVSLVTIGLVVARAVNIL